MMLFLFCFIKGIVYPLVRGVGVGVGVGLGGGEKNGVDF